jgi:hypothetical protein
LTDERALAVHRWAHALALVLLAVAIALDSTWLVRAAAVAGVAGAFGFGAFLAILWVRIRRRDTANG